MTEDEPPEIAGMLAAKRGKAEDVFGHFDEGADLIVGLGLPGNHRGLGVHTELLSVRDGLVRRAREIGYA